MMRFANGSLSFTVSFGEVTKITPPVYLGTTTLRAKTYESVSLPTSGLSMRSDVTVQKIPQFEIDNDEGGITLIIGEEHLNDGL